MTSPTSPDIELSITPRRGALVVGAIALALLLAHLVAVYLEFVTGHDYAMGFVPLFDMDEENNLPTFFSSLVLLLNSLCLAIIARGHRRRAGSPSWHWTLLSILFLFLALDESASIHELLMHPLQNLGANNPILHFEWVIVYIPLVVLLGVVYLRFLARLPRRSALLFVTAGALYIGGAAGVEMVSSVAAAGAGEENLRYALITTTEEMLEVTGMVLFLYALLDYIAATGVGDVVRLRIQRHLADASARAGRGMGSGSAD